MIPWVCTAVEKSSLPFRRHGHRFQPSVLARDNNVTLCQLCAADATAAPKLWGWSWRPLCCTSWLMPLTSTISILGARRGHWHSGHQHWLWQRCQQPTTCTSVEFFRTLKSARFRDIKDCWLCATHSGPFYIFLPFHLEPQAFHPSATAVAISNTHRRGGCFEANRIAARAKGLVSFCVALRFGQGLRASCSCNCPLPIDTCKYR